MPKKDKTPRPEGVVIRTVKEPKKGEQDSSYSPKTKYDYILKNKKSRFETKHKRLITVFSVLMVCVLLGVGLFYGMYTAIKVNSFKVFIDSSGSKVLSLSAEREFASGSEILEITGPSHMDNTTLAEGMSLVTSPSIEERLISIVTTDGFICADNDRFVASTFYLKNTTGNNQMYTEQLRIRNVTNHIDSAMRVMLIRNYEIMVYALPRMGLDGLQSEQVVPLTNPYTKLQIVPENGGVRLIHVGEEAWMAEDFYSDEYVFNNTDLTIDGGGTVKYSIIIWLEGWDLDCTDDKIKGIIQMDFAFVQQSAVK